MAITRKGEKKANKISAAKLAQRAAEKSKSKKAGSASHDKAVLALGKDLLRVLDAASAAIDNGVSAKNIIKAIELTSTVTDKVKSVKGVNSRSSKSKGAASFERATKAFGYTLRDGRVAPADLKEKFKSNLERAKKDHPELRVSMFNKVMTVGSGKKAESYLISGLRKTGGEWVFVTHTADGSKVNVSVANSL